jgi:hypothetical protein
MFRACCEAGPVFCRCGGIPGNQHGIPQINSKEERPVYCHVERSRDISQSLSAAEDCHGPAGLAKTKRAVSGAGWRLSEEAPASDSPDSQVFQG